MDHDLNVVEASYSVATLQRTKKKFRIHSKFLRDIFMNLKFIFFSAG